MYSEYDDYISHYGIKGQRWGVRRYQNSDGSLTEAGKKRYLNKYVTDEDDDGNPIYAYELNKRGSKAFDKFKKTRVPNWYAEVERQNYQSEKLLKKNKSGIAPTTDEMLSSLLEREGELFQKGRMFTNEYLAVSAALAKGYSAREFEQMKDEASWRYRTGRDTSAENWNFTEQDFGRKKFKHEK